MFAGRRHLKLSLAASAVAGAIFFVSTPPVTAAPGSIVFYEGNGGSQDIVDAFDDNSGQNRKLRQNDEARSLVLHDVRAGAVITVFDDPSAKRTDDYCIITVLKKSEEYTVRTFERSYKDRNVRVSYVKRNGLDGKVSRVRID